MTVENLKNTGLSSYMIAKKSDGLLPQKTVDDWFAGRSVPSKSSLKRIEIFLKSLEK